MKTLLAFIVVLGLFSVLPASAPVEAQLSGGRPFTCTVTVSTATTVQAVGGDCVAPSGGQGIFVTDIVAASSAAAGTTADTMNTLKYGTGGTCGTGTTVIWAPLYAANSTVAINMTTPLVIPAQNELCWINSTAGTKTWLISGFIR